MAVGKIHHCNVKKEEYLGLESYVAENDYEMPTVETTLRYLEDPLGRKIHIYSYTKLGKHKSCAAIYTPLTGDKKKDYAAYLDLIGKITSTAPAINEDYFNGYAAGDSIGEKMDDFGIEAMLFAEENQMGRISDFSLVAGMFEENADGFEHWYESVLEEPYLMPAAAAAAAAATTAAAVIITSDFHPLSAVVGVSALAFWLTAGYLKLGDRFKTQKKEKISTPPEKTSVLAERIIENQVKLQSAGRFNFKRTEYNLNKDKAKLFENFSKIYQQKGLYLVIERDSQEELEEPLRTLLESPIPDNYRTQPIQARLRVQEIVADEFASEEEVLTAEEEALTVEIFDDGHTLEI